ncbi:MAG: DUF2335 domain-containing protein [Magnetococcales bacterium]|nr:DUF2335 domain-containing protein [Magnetococcales bacterium]
MDDTSKQVDDQAITDPPTEYPSDDVDTVTEGDIIEAVKNSPQLAGLILSNSSEMQVFSSPLPDAAQLERIEKLHPGITDRLLTASEEESKHRRKMEEKALDAQIDNDSRNQRNGLIVVMSSLCIACALGLTGHPEAASIIGGGTVIGLATVFVLGRKPDKSDSSRAR